MESVINVENFYFAYKKSDLVLRDINFEIKKGSFTVITGPSGAGKTTLCKAMTGIVPYYMADATAAMLKLTAKALRQARQRYCHACGLYYGRLRKPAGFIDCRRGNCLQPA